MSIAFLVIFGYIALGVIFYTQVEEWSFVDALYFTITTLTTVGYGDVVPKDDSGKLFTAFFILLGLCLIGSALGIVSGFLMDMAEKVVPDDGDDSNDWSPATIAALEGAGSLLFFMALGSIFLCLHEDHSFIDSIYGSVATISTVGLGDISVKTERGRALAVPFILFSVIIVSNALSGIVGVFLEARRKNIEARLLAKRLTMSQLLTHAGDDGMLNMEEFVLLKLQSLGKFDQEDIASCKKTFQEFDLDGSGHITVNEVLDK